MKDSRRNLIRERQKLLQVLNRLSTSISKNFLADVEVLYETDLRVLEDFLLQVAHVCMTQTHQEAQAALHQYMLWLSGQSLQIAFRLSWIVDAVSPFLLTTGVRDRVKALQDTIESYAINQARSRPSLVSSSPLTDAVTISYISPKRKLMVDGKNGANLQDILRKELRLRIYNDQRAFVSQLTDISEELRAYTDRSKRKKALQAKLQRLHQSLGDKWVMHPLGKSSDPVQWIVGIAIEECVVFSSRERAPFLVRYEVLVDPSATMQDPSLTTLRVENGDFRVTPDGDERYVPQVRAHLSPASPASLGGNGGVGEPSVLSSSSPTPLSATSTGVKKKGEQKREDIGAGEAPRAKEEEKLQRMAFGESSAALRTRYRTGSQWGDHPHWDMKSMIVKAGDDLRQEELALQLVQAIHNVWKEEGITCSAKPYVACATHVDRGVLEFVDDSNSIDGIKKSTGVLQLSKFFESAFGGRGTGALALAQQRFVESMAGYSVISYLLQIKDRHNGNLMISRKGELVHIDFGFLLTSSPGGWNFESAPFKLSQDLIDVMDGVDSDAFNYYKVLVFLGADAVRRKARDIISLLAVMSAYNSMPCFGSDPGLAVNQLRDRLSLDLSSKSSFPMFVKNLISTSADNWRTRRYDQFQTLQNGIL